MSPEIESWFRIMPGKELKLQIETFEKELKKKKKKDNSFSQKAKGKMQHFIHHFIKSYMLYFILMKLN